MYLRLKGLLTDLGHSSETLDNGQSIEKLFSLGERIACEGCRSC